MSENNVRSIYVYMASKEAKSKPMSKKKLDENAEATLNETRRVPTLTHFNNKIDKINQSLKPTLIILCGPPGSGKSTIKTKILELKNLAITNVFIVDPDKIRTKLLKNVSENINYKVLSKIVNDIAKQLLNTAIEKGINIVFDTTGQDPYTIPQLVKNVLYFKRFETTATTPTPQTTSRFIYHTILAVVWATEQKCVDNVAKRDEEQTDVRINPNEDVIRGIYQKFTENENGIASKLLLGYEYEKKNSKDKTEQKQVKPLQVNEILLYNNNGCPDNPVLLFRKSGNEVILTVTNPGFYNMNINENFPHISLASSLHLRPFKTPPKEAVMSDEGDADLASSMPNGVKEEESKAKKPKTSHGAGKTKKQHKHKRRNTRKN